MSETTATIRRIRHQDAPVISAAFRALEWPGKTVEQYERYIRQDVEGIRTCFVAEADGQIAGYCTLLWEAAYPPFRRAEIPEVSDLNVLPPYRNRGIGSRLLDIVEAAAASERSGSVGLGVGLYADYGAAQRIYARRGYVPDGHGIMHGNAPVEPGAEIRIDDDVTLMLVLAL
ncbi:MAG: GNAT family N-acetyltransferase [Cryobacterium sp.]|nr:GNAT family N-acetyltransferase [Cryobacterium sp.]